MTDNLYVALAAILLLPMIPAFILYKFLPSKEPDEVGGETGSIGPLKGLSWKLKGAFAGYFLLVMVGLALQYFVMNSKQEKQINALTQSLKLSGDSILTLKSQILASANPVIDWHVKGAVTPGGKEGTRFFYDDGTTENAPDGSFELIKRCIASQGKAKPPKWVCIYNSTTGFKVISLNREIEHPDIAAFNIAFDDNTHEILIKKPIDINSQAKDSVIAVANFIQQNPELTQKVNEIKPDFLQKANKIKIQEDAIKVQNRQFEKLMIEKAKLRTDRVHL